LLLVILVLLAAYGCGSLSESHTTMPIKEYEKLIAGRLDADYVGTDTCVEKCHTHDELTKDFRMSIHGGQVTAGTGIRTKPAISRRSSPSRKSPPAPSPSSASSATAPSPWPTSPPGAAAATPSPT
jgi:hypothetical protein